MIQPFPGHLALAGLGLLAALLAAPLLGLLTLGSAAALDLLDLAD